MERGILSLSAESLLVVGLTSTLGLEIKCSSSLDRRSERRHFGETKYP